MGLLQSVITTIKEYRRVLRVTVKPNGPEFWTIVKVSGIGILIIGLIGFILQMSSEAFT